MSKLMNHIVKPVSIIILSSDILSTMNVVLLLLLLLLLTLKADVSASS